MTRLIVIGAILILVLPMMISHPERRLILMWANDWMQPALGPVLVSKLKLGWMEWFAVYPLMGWNVPWQGVGLSACLIWMLQGLVIWLVLLTPLYWTLPIWDGWDLRANVAMVALVVLMLLAIVWVREGALLLPALGILLLLLKRNQSNR